MTTNLLSQQHQQQIAAKSQLDWTLSQIQNLRGIDATTQDVSDLYATSVFLHATANFWADAVSGAKFNVLENGVQVADTHPLQLLLNNSGDLMRRSELSRIIFGRNLIRKNRNMQQRVYGLEWVNPTLFRPDVSSTEGLRGFKLFTSRYHVNTANYVELRNAIYSTEIDFDDDFDGISPAEVAFLQASSEVELATTALAWFRNSMMMGGIFQPAADNNALVDKTTISSFLDLLRRRFQGAKNAGRSLVQSLRWEWIQTQQDFDKVALKDTYESVRQNVSIATNVPVEFITTGQSNYAEIEGKINLWYHVRLMPVLRRYADDFTVQLLSEFGSQYTVEPDISDLIRADEGQQLEIVERKVQSTMLDLYSAQEELGVDTPDINLKGLYMVQGFPFPIPSAELPNVWKMQLQGQSSGGFGQASPIPDTGGSALLDPPELDMPTMATFIPDDQFKELQDWSRLALRKSADYPFKATALPDEAVQFIQWGLSLDSDIEDVFASAENLLRNEPDDRWLVDSYQAVKRASDDAVKAIGQTESQWLDTMNPVIKELSNGNLTQSRGQIIMHNAIDRFGRLAYLDGLIDGGIPDAQMTLQDFRALSNMFTRQKQYASKFVQKALADGLTDTQVAGKAKEWFNGSIMPFFYEGQKNGKDNPNEIWDMDESKENCDSCKRLNGQVHRRSTWNAKGLYPNSMKLDCGAGKRCGCERSPTALKARGRFLGYRSSVAA